MTPKECSLGSVFTSRVTDSVPVPQILSISKKRSIQKRLGESDSEDGQGELSFPLSPLLAMGGFGANSC